MQRMLFTISFVVLWAAVVVSLLLAEEAFVKPDVQRGDAASLESYLVDQLNDALADNELGCATLALVQGGSIVAEHGFGLSDRERLIPADPARTLFLLSSLSKAVTTWGALALVRDGKIGLDEPVLPYLIRWRFPGSEEYRESVTLRQLLSHTAGLVDGYGHAGFLPGEKLQTIEEMLTMPADANMGPPKPATIVIAPGTQMVYSSAGYGIIQLLIEELSGLPFNSYMKQAVFEPLGMANSYFELDSIAATGKSKLLAANYDTDLSSFPHRRYTNMAGVSLRSTAHDMAILASAYWQKNPVIGRDLLKQSWTPQPGTSGSWGLGHTLYGQNGSGNHLFGHGGGSFPASGAEMQVNPDNGDAIVMLASGTLGLISELADVWTYWESGRKDFDVRRIVSRRLVPGLAAIVIGSVLIGYLQYGRRRTRHY